MKYTIIYTTDYNVTQRAAEIQARDYTAAYLLFIYSQPLDTIILEITAEQPA